ncbi:MAG: cobalt transporter CbiM [Desulfurobacteriaceae bacterium]
MHISEGILPGWILTAGWGLTIAGTAAGLKKIDDRKIPLVALLSSVFFVASLIHIPVGITSVHLLTNGLAGMLLGWAAFPAMLVALFLQAVLFQFGGLTVLGVNTFNMALPGVIAHYLTRKITLKHPSLAGIIGATVGVFGGALLLSSELWLSGSSFKTTAKLAFLAHIPVAVTEAVIYAFIFNFLKRVLPEVLEVKNG